MFKKHFYTCKHVFHLIAQYNFILMRGNTQTSIKNISSINVKTKDMHKCRLLSAHVALLKKNIKPKEKSVEKFFSVIVTKRYF